MPKSPPPKGGPADLKQVWFAGVHSDVGGGYAERDCGLSKIALQWMLKEAMVAGLLVDETQMRPILGEAEGGYVRPNPAADMHKSVRGA
jgi:hypothetical protein